MAAKPETALSILAFFDDRGEPFVEIALRVGRDGRGSVELPVASAIARLEREGASEDLLTQIAADAGRLKMAVADALLKREEAPR